MLKKTIVSLLLAVVLIMSFSVPIFAAAEAPSDAPGLVSERMVTDDYGNEILIRLYNLDENGNLPVREARAKRILFNNSTWLSTGGYANLVPSATSGSTFTEAVTCRYGGDQAVTFNCNGATQAVAAGQACQFFVSGKGTYYYVMCKANWSDHQAWVTITGE